MGNGMSYSGEITPSNTTSNAIFTWPIEPHSTDLEDRYLAINAPSAEANTGQPWDDYPNELENVGLLKNTITLDGTVRSNTFADTFTNSPTFSFVGNKERYTLLKAEKITYCLTAGELKRTRTTASTNSESLMLTGLAATTDHVFGEYDQQSQLLTVDFILTTKDGDLVLSSQLQVGYEP